MSKKIDIRIRGDEFFICAMLICCAWGKLDWAWFWLVFILDVIVSCKTDEDFKKEDNHD